MDKHYIEFVYKVLCLIQNVRGRGILGIENKESRTYGMTGFNTKNNAEIGHY